MSTTIEIYQIDVENEEFRRIEIIDTYQDLFYTYKKNGLGACRFSLNLNDLKAIQSNFIRYRNQVAIKRNGVIVWVGTITNIYGSYRNLEGAISVECYSYLEHLFSRLTEKNTRFDQVTQDEIAWSLIEDSQARPNGTLLITEGTLASTKIRDRAYQNYVVGEAITNLSEVIGGLNFDLKPIQDANGMLTSVEFNTYSRLGIDRNDYVITNDKVDSIGFASKTYLHNTIIAEGSGSGDNIYQYATSNSDLQKAYSRREFFLKEYDVVQQSTLVEKSEEYLNLEGVETYDIEFVIKPNVRPEIHEIGVGDIVNFDLSAGNFFKQKGRGEVIQVEIEIDSNGAEYIRPIIRLIV